MLFENNCISNKEDFLNDIEICERLSVMLMDGIVYLYLKSKVVIKFVIVVGVKYEGIEYGDEEGIKLIVFFMIVFFDNGVDYYIYVF